MQLGVGLYISQRLSRSQMRNIVWSTWTPQWTTLTQTWEQYK